MQRKVVLIVLIYIKRSPRKGLFYKKHVYIHILDFSDTGYGGDKGDRKSITGYHMFVGENIVKWRSMK